MTAAACAALLGAPTGAWAQEAQPETPQAAPQTGAPAEWMMHMLEPYVVTFLEAERLEGRRSGGEHGYLLDLQGWVGTDAGKFWAKVEGDGEFDGALEGVELQALYSRPVSPFFDLQLGVRQDLATGEPRTHAVVGVQGLAPYWFEVDAAAFVSHTGDVTARLEAEYDLLLSQRLVLQPRTELDVAFQDVEALGLGAGLSSGEAGVRLRYEFRREVAPYVGVSWRRAFGGTADAVRAGGDRVAGVALVVGMRLWH
jgi:copper resistance protein B